MTEENGNRVTNSEMSIAKGIGGILAILATATVFYLVFAISKIKADIAVIFQADEKQWAYLSQLSKRVKASKFSKNLSDPSGPEKISGVGFAPSLVYFFCMGDGSNTLASLGTDLGDGQGSVYAQFTDGTGASKWNGMVPNSINWVLSTGVSYKGHISSKHSDGFTITWTREGSPTGMNYCGFIAYP